MKKTMPYLILLILAVILVSMSTSFPFNKVGLFWDAAVYLNASKNLLQGQILYKDIIDNKGPVLYFINAIGLKLNAQIGACIIEFLFIYLTFIYMYKSVQLLNNNKIHSLFSVFIVFICYAKFFTYGLSCETYALTFSTIAMYECIKFYKNGKFTEIQCIVIGLLCGLTFFIRANLIVVFVGFGIGIGINLLIEKRFKELLRYILFAALGFIIVCVPIFIYLLYNNCFYDFIDIVFKNNFSMKKLGLLNSIYLIRKFSPIAFLVLFINIFICWFKAFFNPDKKENKQWNKLITILALTLVTILFNCVSKTIYRHYLISFLPIILLAFNNVIEILLKIIRNKNLTYTILILIIGTYVIINHNKLFIFQTIQPNSNIIQYIKENTNSNDKISIIGFADEIYYLSNRESASRIDYFLNNTFDDNAQSKMFNQFIEEIKENFPEIIVQDDGMLFNLKNQTDITEYTNIIKNKYSYVKVIDNKKIYRYINEGN